MYGYHFTASVTRSQVQTTNPGRGHSAEPLRTWASCQSLIVCAENAEAAQGRFEEWLRAQPEGEAAVETEINRMVAAEFLGDLLTETGPVPMDWPAVARQARADLESTAADDFEQGYWLDANEAAGPSNTVDGLREGLPEEVRSGLNWSETRQFYFLLSVLSPAAPPAEALPDEEDGLGEEAEPADDVSGGTAMFIEGGTGEFPELAEKEAAVLIRARNAAVAAWLWRNYAANTPLAGKLIRMDPLCGIAGPEAESAEPTG